MKCKIYEISNEKKGILLAFTVAILCSIGLIWLLPVKDDLSLHIEYAREYNNYFHAQLFWNLDGGYAEEKSSYRQVQRNKVELKIDASVEEISELRFDPMDEETEAAITSIQVRNHGIGMYVIPVREILGTAQFHSLDIPEVTRGVLYLRAQSEDPSIILGKDILETYIVSCRDKFKLVLSIWILLAGVLAIVAVANAECIKSFFKYIADRFYSITRIVLVIALFLVAYMAFHSFDYAHPDENMSKAAVDYYVNHWKPADIRSPEVEDSFSAYGNSRLSEITVYYFLAGKVAWVAKNVLGLNKYYRAFNVLLFAIMVGIYCINGKKNVFLFFMLGLSPQVWYIFSYTTSDAWDYFLSFLILYQLMVEESLFNRAMGMEFTPKAVVHLAMSGILYGMLFLGKQNYYFVFVASFLVLLFRLLIKYKKARVQILIKYGIIIFVCFLIYEGAKLTDNVRYDGHKAEILSEMYEKHVERAKGNNQEDTREGIWAGKTMKAQGIAFSEIFSTYDFHGYSYRSYTGTYGWMEYESQVGYYVFMGILYIIIVAGLFGSSLGDGNNEAKLLFFMLMLLNITVFGASAWHSWTSDFQPQGRYLFSMNFIIALCGYLYKKEIFYKKITVRAASCLATILSIYSYLISGIFYLT